MNENIFRSLLFLLAIAVTDFAIAQDTKPVQFAFNAVRINDSTLQFKVEATIAKNTQLFSVKNQGG